MSPTNELVTPSSESLRIFEQLRAGVTSAQVVTLKDDIDRHLLQIQKLARKNEMTPLDLAEAIAGRLHVLLAELESFPAEHQSAILGAALYFVSQQDEIPDHSSILGLDDDASIFNYVARLIGRPELEVEL